MRRVTLAQVAERAGVSVMTASYTYNRPERVSDEARSRVLAAAAELGYAGPDPSARSLRRGSTRTLGVVMGEHLSYAFEDPQAVSFLAGIADVCADARLRHDDPADHGRADGRLPGHRAPRSTGSSSGPRPTTTRSWRRSRRRSDRPSSTAGRPAPGWGWWASTTVRPPARWVPSRSPAPGAGGGEPAAVPRTGQRRSCPASRHHATSVPGDARPAAGLPGGRRRTSGWRGATSRSRCCAQQRRAEAERSPPALLTGPSRPTPSRR